MLHLDLAKGAQFVDGRSVEPAAGLAEVREGANVDRAIQVDRRQVPEKIIALPSGHGGQARGEDGVDPVVVHLPHGGTLQLAAGEELRHGGGDRPGG
jgi:hypothetical protein